jgi:hypothetical protein
VAAYEIVIDSYQALGFDLEAAVADFQVKLVAHAATIGVAAPTAHGVVETIVRYHDGEFVIVPAPPPPPLTPLPKNLALYRGFANPREFAGTTLSAAREAKEALRIAAENAAVAKTMADQQAAYDAAMVVQKEAEAQQEFDRLAYIEQQAAEIAAAYPPDEGV